MYFEQPGVRKELELTEEEWAVITEIMLMLKPLYDATIRCQFQTKQIGSYRFAILNTVYDTLKELQEGGNLTFTTDRTTISGRITTDMGKEMLRRMKEYMKIELSADLLPNLGEKRYQIEAMYLDPRMNLFLMQLEEGKHQDRCHRKVHATLVESLAQMDDDLYREFTLSQSQPYQSQTQTQATQATERTEATNPSERGEIVANQEDFLRDEPSINDHEIMIGRFGNVVEPSVSLNTPVGSHANLFFSVPK